MTYTAEELSRAILVWTGYGTAPAPRHDDDAVQATFGDDAALDLVPAVRLAVADFDQSTAFSRFEDLDEMGRAAGAEFRERRPELSSDAIDALAWRYRFRWK